MRKKSLALTLMLAFSCLLGGGDLMGQTTVTIGNGTSGSYVLPFNLLQRWGYAEYIYSSSDINQSENKKITSIAFYYIGNHNGESFTFDLYLKNDTKNSYSSGTDYAHMSSSDKYFSGTLTLPNSAGWVTITLNNSFNYDYTKNLIVAINRTDKSEGSTGYSTSAGFYTTTNSTTYYSIHYAFATGDSPYDPATISSSGSLTKGFPNIQITFKDEATFPVPTGLTASPIKTHEATLTWNEPENAISYNVKYHETPEGEWTTETGLTTNILALSNMDAETEYETQVQAVYSEGSSDWSASYSFTTLPLEENKYDKNSWGNAYNWNSGIPTVNHDVLISQNIYVNVAAAANNITITAGKTMTIQNGYSLTCNHITNNGTLVIEDGGQLICNNSVTATFQKEITGYGDVKDNYFLIANPTTGDINPTTVSGMLTPNYDFYYFDEAEEGAEWRNYKQEEFDLENGKGYLYANSSNRTLQFSGTVPTGTTANITLSKSGSGTYAGFNLVGNPLSNNVTNTKIGELTCSYYKVNSSTGVFAVSTDPIIVGEAFMVQAPSDGATLKLNQGAKDENGFNNDVIRLEVSNSKFTDVAYVYFGNHLPLTKINHLNDEAPMLYIRNGNDDRAVEVYSNREEVNSINVCFEAKTMGQYTISAKMVKGAIKYMHLIDKYTGEDIDMLVEDSYTFIGAPNDSNDRFMLRFTYDTAIEEVELNSVFVHQSGSEVIVEGEGQLQVFDMMGRMVMNQRVNGTETVNGLNNGVYVFRMNEKMQKVVIR